MHEVVFEVLVMENGLYESPSGLKIFRIIWKSHPWQSLSDWNHFRHLLKVVVIMSVTSPRWITWVTQLVNRQIQPYSYMSLLRSWDRGLQQSQLLYTWRVVPCSRKTKGAVMVAESWMGFCQTTCILYMAELEIGQGFSAQVSKSSLEFLARGSLTSLCCTRRWALHTMSVASVCFFDKTTGCLCNCPPHRQIWLSSW